MKVSILTLFNLLRKTYSLVNVVVKRISLSPYRGELNEAIDFTIFGLI